MYFSADTFTNATQYYFVGKQRLQHSFYFNVRYNTVVLSVHVYFLFCHLCNFSINLKFNRASGNDLLSGA